MRRTCDRSLLELRVRATSGSELHPHADWRAAADSEEAHAAGRPLAPTDPTATLTPLSAMHIGRLPGALIERVPAPSPSPRPLVTRRRFASIVLGAVATTGLGWWAVRVYRGNSAGPGFAPAKNERSVAIPRRGTLDWALALADADPGVLLPAAGDLERVAARQSGDQRLIPVFCRVLDLALLSNAGFADSAAACALRSLVLFRATDQVEARRGGIMQRREFEQANRELEAATATRRRGAGR